MMQTSVYIVLIIIKSIISRISKNIKQISVWTLHDVEFHHTHVPILRGSEGCATQLRDCGSGSKLTLVARWSNPLPVNLETDILGVILDNLEFFRC